MRTNIVLDDKLIDEAMRVTRLRTKREVVDLALRELLVKHRSQQVKALRGRPLIDPAYDIREVRKTMGRDAR
jgi:Arc/MetJ family transcription regulator